MEMKKLVVSVLVISMVLMMFLSCSKEEPAATETKAAETTQKVYTMKGGHANPATHRTTSGWSSSVSC
jgi:hypothetical protein